MVHLVPCMAVRWWQVINQSNQSNEWTDAACAKPVPAPVIVPEVVALDAPISDKGNGKGAQSGGGTTEISASKIGEGVGTCGSSKILKRRDMRAEELRAINFWSLCDGDMQVFDDQCGTRDNKKMLRLLNTERVRQYIGVMADKGECLPLVADKGEIEQLLTHDIRRFGKLDSMQELNKMKGYIPRDVGGGGTLIQINISGGLED